MSNNLVAEIAIGIVLGGVGLWLLWAIYLLVMFGRIPGPRKPR